MSQFNPYSNRPGAGQNPFGGPSGTPGYGTGPYVPPAQYQRPMPPAQQAPRHNPGGGWSGGVTHAVGFVVVIWAVHIVNTLFFGGALNYFGIHPLDVSSLWGILTSPLLHANFEHLISNTVPGAIFAFLIGFSGRRVFWEVTAITVLIGGLGTWVFGGVGTNHIGASGLVYGWWAYLLVRGLFNRSGSQILLGVILGVLYSGLVWGILPGTEGVSWQAHLFGAIGGVVAGMTITSDDPPALRARRAARAAR